MTTITTPTWQQLNLADDIRAMLEKAPSVTLATSVKQLEELAVRDADDDGYHEVKYTLPDGKEVTEARVCLARNGIVANYLESYMRRRDPDCMVIGDQRATDKQRYEDRFGQPFANIRQETIEWLSTQDLALLPFYAGMKDAGLPALAICPANAGFFALGLALLQGMVDNEEWLDGFEPKAMIFVAPPFRHTHFEGKQVVVHNRRGSVHELYSYNLYPGPSAKKGVYGMLINLGEQLGWVTAHCSTVRVTTPYDNHVVIMHEGASGGGKSEMLEYMHREPDGRLLLGTNTVTKESRHLTMARGCRLAPVTDDMALCQPEPVGRVHKLALCDAEQAWFIRVNHIDTHGKDPHLEGLTVAPPQPLLFLNIDAVPDSRALLWEHIEDEPGTPCPNPRVIVPRDLIPNIVSGDVVVDIRSFGVRCPPCTKEKPTYGIIGLFHVLNPALAWLWRLVAPRGHGNPSVVQSEGMASEGVGSYWPFATGRRVDQANLLLKQIADTRDTIFILCPNQHVGAWHVGFAPQWITREYLARRGANPFRPEQLQPSRCPLLGSTLDTLAVEGTTIGHWFLQVESQPEVGEETYDKGAEMLYKFFREQLDKFLVDDLDPLGRQIIECCKDGGSQSEYEKLIPVEPF